MLDLIEARNVGIIDNLNDLNRFRDSQPESLVTKVYQNPDLKANKRLVKPKFAADKKIYINHYAGTVDYDVSNFLEKNQDYTVPEHEELL